MHGSNIDDYIQTMRTLLGLPVSVVHPGHGGNFDQVRLYEIAPDYLRHRAGATF